jgi:hypothetical protein
MLNTLVPITQLSHVLIDYMVEMAEPPVDPNIPLAFRKYVRHFL